MVEFEPATSISYRVHYDVIINVVYRRRHAQQGKNICCKGVGGRVAELLGASESQTSCLGRWIAHVIQCFPFSALPREV